MDQLKDILFNASFDYDYQDWALRILVFVVIWAILLYLGYIFFTKLIFASSKVHRDYQMQLNFLWSLGVAQVGFVIYFFFLIKYNGLDLFKLDINLVALVPPLLVLMASVILFLVFKTKYLKTVKGQSIK